MGMQCSARVALMKLSVYNELKKQKVLLSSIQRNIRIYYAVRGWKWFQFYTMVKGEMGKILEKTAEDAANETNKKLNALQQKAAKEKADLKAALAKAKTEMQLLLLFLKRRQPMRSQQLSMERKKLAASRQSLPMLLERVMSWPSWVTLPSLTRPELPFSGIRRRHLLPLAMQRRCTGYTTGLSRSSPKPVSTSKC